MTWLFDLDNTLHDAGAHVFPALRDSMAAYVQRELKVDAAEAERLRREYFVRYGATLLGLVRHHGVRPAHFLHDTHRLPELDRHVAGQASDFAAIRRLRGRKLVLTNAPRAYALRVMRLLGIEGLFDAVLSIEDMSMFGQLRPKPDARMLRRVAVRLRVRPGRCTLVEDTLVHQKAARRVGMHTVWMQRFVRAEVPGRPGGHGEPRWSMRPAYVDRVVRSLRALLTSR
ncbi:MAG: pyrimidine 5'-nucleotidase [Ideonella sp.]|nr:pyrimidine 5'-nucleotidase [Ideonella sp.]